MQACPKPKPPLVCRHCGQVGHTTMACPTPCPKTPPIDLQWIQVEEEEVKQAQAECQREVMVVTRSKKGKESSTLSSNPLTTSPRKGKGKKKVKLPEEDDHHPVQNPPLDLDVRGEVEEFI